MALDYAAWLCCFLVVIVTVSTFIVMWSCPVKKTEGETLLADVLPLLVLY